MKDIPLVLKQYKRRHITPIVEKRLQDLQLFRRCGNLLLKYAEKESISDLNTPDIHWVFSKLGLAIPKDYYSP